MEFKQLLSKTLLVAVGLLVGTSSWADVTAFSESYSSTSTTDGWKTSVNGRFTPVILNDESNYYLSVTQGERNNNGCVVTGEILKDKAAAGENFTLMFDMRLSNSNDQSPVVLAINDAANTGVIFSLTATAKKATTWKVNGQSLTLDLPNSGNDKSVADITWISYKISRSGSLTYLTVTNKETSEVILARQTIDGASETGGLGNIVFTTKRKYANFAIDNIELRALQDGDVPVVTPVNYTIKYVDESSNTIKDDVVIASYVGAENIEATASQMAAIMYNEKKYIYKSGNTPITLVADAASNVITLVYREAATYSYTINAVYNNNIIEAIKSGSTFEGDAVSYINKHFYNIGGTLVKKAASSNSYSSSSTPASDGDIISVEYENGNKTSIVFLAEAEDIATLTPVTSAYLSDRFSGGKGGYAKDENKVITSLPRGKYKLTAHIMGTASECTFTFKAGESTIWENKTTSTSFYPGDGITSDEFTLTDNTDIILVAAGGDGSSSRVTNAVDFIYIEKTGESIDIKTTGTTFSSAYAIDCSKLPEGVKAYKVASIDKDNKKAILAEVTEAVEAETGLILIAETAGTFNIPVVATGTDISATNLLKAAVTAKTVAANEAYGLSEGKFKKLNAGSVPAGKAYLLASDITSAPELDLDFGGVTAITNTNCAKDTNIREVYNLNGQRVAQPTRGLYIQNGRKVILK